MLEYKGYIGDATFDSVAHLFHGEIINTRDVITFQGTSVEELEKAFRDSIDDYLEWCREDGVEPEKPYSGRLLLRISPELHSKIAAKAKEEKISINKFAEEALQRVV